MLYFETAPSDGETQWPFQTSDQVLMTEPALGSPRKISSSLRLLQSLSSTCPPPPPPAPRGFQQMPLGEFSFYKSQETPITSTIRALTFVTAESGRKTFYGAHTQRGYQWILCCRCWHESAVSLGWAEWGRFRLLPLGTWSARFTPLMGRFSFVGVCLADFLCHL